MSIYQIGKRMLYGDQQMNDEVLVKRQIFLDSIDDLFDVIEGHLMYENNLRNKVKNSIQKKAFNYELLKRVDSLMKTLQIFSFSCVIVKSEDDTDALKLGKLLCKQKLEKMFKCDRKKYEAFVDIMYYALDGNKIAFPKRQPTQNELNPNFNGKNMNDVLGELIGGQHVVNANRKKYKANTKELKGKYDVDLKKAKNLPKIKKVQLPEVEDLYKVFNIKNQKFVSRKQKTKENKKLNIKNGFIKSGNYSWKYNSYQRVHLETPFPCLILEDVFNNDNKILVQLAYPYNYEFRPYKKDVFWCEDEEAKKKIIAVELKHLEKFYYLSLSNNKSYKSIADPFDIKEAIARYHQHNDNNDYAPDVDTLHHNNYNKNRNNSGYDDYKHPSIDDSKNNASKSNASKRVKKKKDNVPDNFDDDHKDCSINTTKIGHDMDGHGYDRHGQHNHDNCRQHNVVKRGNNSDKHVKPDVDKIHNDENIDSDGDANMSNPGKCQHQRTSSDQEFDKYNKMKMDINTYHV